ncbi:SubName: Full=Uncharacterized protein {ECO:0000313/EMBL:CCA70893.1} [Serendipita indica DSM 11827]|nr:SubName: Full=Uncharacterized protein {ECO:0000313/EMBL:CCA70893.1} [Serendipita indica DSM 11827]
MSGQEGKDYKVAAGAAKEIIIPPDSSLRVPAMSDSYTFKLNNALSSNRRLVRYETTVYKNPKATNQTLHKATLFVTIAETYDHTGVARPVEVPFTAEGYRTAQEAKDEVAKVATPWLRERNLLP